MPYVPASTITPRDWLSRSAATTPDRVALIAGGERTSFKELEREASAMAGRMDLRAGDRLAFAPTQSRDDVVLLHALIKAGAIAVPLDPRLPSEELDRRAAAVGATFEGADPAVQDRPPRELDLDAVHCVIHTSGTAGDPKAVELTYGNHLWSALGSAAQDRRRPGRPLALLPAAPPRRRARDRSAQRGVRHSGRARTIRRRARARSDRHRARHARLAGRDDARAAARRGRRARSPSLRSRRRWAGWRGSARASAGRRRSGGAHLRTDRGGLAGDYAPTE